MVNFKGNLSFYRKQELTVYTRWLYKNVVHHAASIIVMVMTYNKTETEPSMCGDWVDSAHTLFGFLEIITSPIEWRKQRFASPLETPCRESGSSGEQSQVRTLGLLALGYQTPERRGNRSGLTGLSILAVHSVDRQMLVGWRLSWATAPEPCSRPCRSAKCMVLKIFSQPPFIYLPFKGGGGNRVYW